MANEESKTAVISLPLTRTEKEPVFVGINGKSYLIQRGVPVTVPYGVFLVLKHREAALTKAMEFEADAAAKGAFAEKE